MIGLLIWIILGILTLLVCFLITLAVRKPMSEMLGVNSYIVPSRKFYLRSFTVLLVLTVLATISETDIPESREVFIEYVWWIINSMQPAFIMLSIWIIAYAALLTLLFVILGRYHD